MDSLFLPYYKRGNLQDAIAANSVNGTSFPEREMLQLFLGTCQAVRAMHTYVSGPSATYPPSSSRSNLAEVIGSNNGSTSNLATGNGTQKKKARKGQFQALEQEEEEEEEAIRGSAGAAEPLIGSIDRMNDDATADETEASDVPGLGSERGAKLIGRLPVPSPLIAGSTSSNGTPQPYAHRDIKPANVMISDENTPVLMDFGSALPARIPIRNRSEALKQADDAGEHCSMPFRAPELFDPPVGSELNERVVSQALAGSNLWAC